MKGEGATVDGGRLRVGSSRDRREGRSMPPYFPVNSLTPWWIACPVARTPLWIA